MNSNSRSEPRIYLCYSCYRALGWGLEDEYVLRFAVIVAEDRHDTKAGGECCEECERHRQNLERMKTRAQEHHGAQAPEPAWRRIAP